MLVDSVLIPKQIDRSDGDVLAGVNDALWEADGLRSLNYKDIEVEARAGEVFLRGHVRSVMHKHEAEQRVAAVRGVEVVHNDLVADSDLEIAVAQALAANQPTRASILRVGASAGWVQLGGEVPDAQVRTEAETVAANVSAVRGVLSLPHLPGEHGSEYQRALQPRAGTAVYADDGEIGTLVGVVVNPRNRLVSHIVVNARLDLGGHEVRGQFVIPAAAIKMSTVSGTILTDSMRDVNARPRFRGADFPTPPANWQLPFPYQASEVYWSA
jgi:osmotically-inducible protein OsmY